MLFKCQIDIRLDDMFSTYERHFVRRLSKEKESRDEGGGEPGVDGLPKPLLIKETLRCLRCKAEYLLAFVKFVFA